MEDRREGVQENRGREAGNDRAEKGKKWERKRQEMAGESRKGLERSGKCGKQEREGRERAGKGMKGKERVGSGSSKKAGMIYKG